MSTFSCVIPVHNAETSIERAVRSAVVAGMTEVVVVDDASSDRSAALVEALAQEFSQVRLLRLQTNLGPGPARNMGVAICSHEWLVFLDADDELSPDYGSVMKTAMQRVPAAMVWVLTGITFTGLNYVNGEADAYDLRDPRYGAMLNTVCWSRVMRRSLFWLAGGFPGGEGFRFGHEDSALAMALMALVPTWHWHVIDAPAMYRYHNRPGSGVQRYLDSYASVGGQVVRLDEAARRNNMVDVPGLELEYARVADAARQRRALLPAIYFASGEFDFTENWFDHNVENWTQWLGSMQGRSGLRFLEIGSFEGRSALWLLQNILTHDDARLICIDSFGGGMEHGSSQTEALRWRFEHNVKSQRHKIELEVGLSAHVLRRLHAPLDAAYIDGSHQAADVLVDACLVWPLLKVGGVLIFDDYAWDLYPEPHLNPRLAIDAFMSTHQGRFELMATGYQVALRKTA